MYSSLEEISFFSSDLEYNNDSFPLSLSEIEFRCTLPSSRKSSVNDFLDLSTGR